MLCACLAQASKFNSLVASPSAVELERDWLDYAAGVGGIAAVVLAAGALVYARRSASDSSRSARAAEETAQAATEETRTSRALLEIAGEQHARLSRRPSLRTTLRLECPLQHGNRIPFVLQCHFMNDGEVAAINSTADVAIPEGMVLARCGPGGAQMTGAMPLTVMTGELVAQGGTRQMQVHSWDIPLIQAKRGTIWHGVFYFPGPGRYEVELRITHPEAGETRDRYPLDVADDGAGAFALVVGPPVFLGIS